MSSPPVSSPASFPVSSECAGELGSTVNLSLQIVAGNQRLYLQGCIGIDNISEYRDQIVDLLGQKPDLVELELSRLDTYGSSVIALLIAIQRFVQSTDRNVIFIHPQLKLLEMLEMASLCDILSFALH